jgi:gluconolactonase
MLILDPPARIRPEIHFRLPDRFREKRATEWAVANKLGQAVDSFLEGPSFDRTGHLWFTDIPFGRIFRLAPDGDCELVIQYDGWPNGLKIHRDGRVFITDHRNGLLVLDPQSRQIAPLLRARNSEGFKGLNDLHFAANGDLYFTDQGQTGMHDPTGRVYRLNASGKLDLLLATIPSPNGVCLDLAETRLCLAVTRANAIWRAPILPDGALTKVGTFIQLSGGLAGPDGIALDAEGGLIVCHLGIGVWRFDALGRPTHVIDLPGVMATNIAFGGPDNRFAYITDSDNGAILRAEMPAPGQRMFAMAG